MTGAVPNTEQLAREFTDDLHESYRYLARKIQYRAKAFIEMVALHGGVGAARILLGGPQTHDGFIRLWEAGELSHSVEACVLHPKYAVLFSEDERRAARQRLEDHDFDVDKHVGSLPDGR
ncbi:hypothetical protein PV646_41900 [Streptomyces sp. ID05-26A]|nr:hypothetical protein [Streptomyces sp. ID05-26A]